VPHRSRNAAFGIPQALCIVLLLAALACGGSGAAQKSASRKPDQPPARSGDLIDGKEDRPSSPRKGSKKKEVEIPTAATIPLLATSRLGVESPPPEGAVQRNLFAFEEDPVIVAKRKKDKEEADARAAAIAEQARIEAAKHAEDLRLHPPPPQPPAINFEFLGYFGDPKKRIGVFSTKGGSDVTLAVEGDKIYGTFHVKEVGFESAEIGFDNFKETKRIPLSATAGGK
jgi:hypothetical protein